MELYSNVLPVFVFNNAKYDLTLIKSYLFSIFVDEQDLEYTVIAKADQFISFMYGDNQLVDILNFHAGHQVLIPCWKLEVLPKPKVFSPINDLITRTNYGSQKFPRIRPSTKSVLVVFFWKQNTWSRFFFWKVERPQSKLLSNWTYRSQHLQELRTISTCKTYGSRNDWVHSNTLLPRYYNKDIVPTLKEVQKIIAFTRIHI